MEVIKSPNDSRVYKAFKLENGLKCVVISDPEADEAAAALDVNVGSASEPDDALGLAHFLEHMLFMGSEKYPDESYYSTFIGANGGSDNAYTDLENTNFQFSVAAHKLQEALDIFAQFFICPLMKPDCVEREMKAVDSEHSKNINSDVWRLQ